MNNQTLIEANNLSFKINEQWRGASHIWREWVW